MFGAILLPGALVIGMTTGARLAGVVDAVIILVAQAATAMAVDTAQVVTTQRIGFNARTVLQTTSHRAINTSGVRSLGCATLLFAILREQIITDAIRQAAALGLDRAYKAVIFARSVVGLATLSVADLSRQILTFAIGEAASRYRRPRALGVLARSARTLGLAAHGSAFLGIHILATDRRKSVVRIRKGVIPHEAAGFGRDHRTLNTVTREGIERLATLTETVPRRDFNTIAIRQTASCGMLHRALDILAHQQYARRRELRLTAFALTNLREYLDAFTIRQAAGHYRRSRALGILARGTRALGLTTMPNAFHRHNIDTFRRTGILRRTHKAAGFGRDHRALNTVTRWSVQRLTAGVEATVHDHLHTLAVRQTAGYDRLHRALDILTHQQYAHRRDLGLATLH